MALEIVRRCSICKSQGCSGREYHVSGRVGQMNTLIDKVVCESDRDLHKRRDGTRFYRCITGHGIWDDLDAVFVEHSDRQDAWNNPA